MLETLDYAIRIGSTPTILYFVMGIKYLTSFIPFLHPPAVCIILVPDLLQNLPFVFQT